MPNEFANQPLGDLCQQCRRERQSYFRENQTTSPACIALFRHAFASDWREEAWACLREIFEPLVIDWSRCQSRFEVEDVVQEVWLSFYRGTVGKFQIRDQEQLAPILDYLKTCTKNVIAQWLRKPAVDPAKLADIFPEAGDPIEQTQLRIDLERYVTEFLAQEHFTDDDRLLFRLKFILHLKPREIQADYPHLAADYEQLENALQKLTRRVSNYADFRKLQSPRRKTDDRAFLIIETEQAMTQKGINVDQLCRHEETVLLDYIMGMADAEMAAAIQASPACLQRVSELTQELGSFLLFSYRMDCPSPETLVAYQQRTLPGSERLVLYRHIEQCARCQEDLMTFEAMDHSAKTNNASVLRRLVEARYQSPLAFGLQGDWLHYRTPDLAVYMSPRQEAGKQRGWSVRIQLRTLQGELRTQLIESARLQLINQESLIEVTGELSTDQSSLIFRDVRAGHYCLSILWPEQEIIIRDLPIGEVS